MLTLILIELQKTHRKQKICRGESGENSHASELPVTDFMVSLNGYVILSIISTLLE